MPTVQHAITLRARRFPIALGAIDSDSRIKNGEITAEGLDAFIEALDHFYTAVATEGDVPSQCVDGRSRQDGTYEPAPKAAAGTFSAVIGDALTNGSHRPAGANAAAHAKKVYEYLIQHGYTIGGHVADHVSGNGYGCGAEDNLERILMFIRDNSAGIQTFLKDVGVTIDDETHARIATRAASLLDENYVVSGAELRDALVATAGEQCVETLTGPHREVVLVINTEPGVTIDRAKIAEEYNDSFQAFELDVPSLQTAANALSLTPAEALQKVTAMLYYNVATAAVLAGSSLRIVVR